MKRIAICAALGLVLWSTSAAPAGLWEDIYRGLDLLATPSGGPLSSTGDGTRFNGQRSGRLRIVPDAVGRGYSLELDRTFGLDSSARPEVLDLGEFEVQLAGPTQATFGYTNRGYLIGTGQMLANNLNYSMRAKNGLQDVELSGVLSSNSTVEIDQFGFYRVDMEINNVDSALTVDGVLVEGNEETNFDIGPISVKGNLFYDGFVALLSGLGVDTSALTDVFPASPMTSLADEIASQLPSLDALEDVVAGVRVTGDGQLPTVPALLASDATAPLLIPAAEPFAVPEPGAACLGLVCLAALLRRARR